MSKTWKIWFNFGANGEHNLLSETVCKRTRFTSLIGKCSHKKCLREGNVSTNFQNSQFSTNVSHLTDMWYKSKLWGYMWNFKGVFASLDLSEPGKRPQWAWTSLPSPSSLSSSSSLCSHLTRICLDPANDVDKLRLGDAINFWLRICTHRHVWTSPLFPLSSWSPSWKLSSWSWSPSSWASSPSSLSSWSLSSYIWCLEWSPCFFLSQQGLSSRTCKSPLVPVTTIMIVIMIVMIILQCFV